jgi:hypothetical protein
MNPPQPVPPAPPGPPPDAKQLWRLYLAGDAERLATEILAGLSHYDKTTYLAFDEAGRGALQQFVKALLVVLTQPDFVIPEKHVGTFVRNNYLISNLAAMTPFRTTDAFLDMLRHQPLNFVKILTLYSARNHTRFDRRTFFDANVPLASLWYNCFCTIYKTGLVNEQVCRHLAEHLAYRDERMVLTSDLQEPYFASTYLDGVTDRDVKPFLNRVARRAIRQVVPARKPDPRKIAVVSDTWSLNHSVYRNYAAYVKELKKDFHLTFFHILKSRPEMEISLFDEVHRLEMKGGNLPIDALASGQFTVIYYPDIGMSLPSILLANHRLAPVQICSPGHSVSTYGAEIDYFMSGADVETPAAPERNYSERLVLLPGMGAVHNRPLYEPVGGTKAVPEFVINCPWSGQKLNPPFCRTLRALTERATRPLRLRVFAGAGLNQNGFLPFQFDLRAAVGSKAVLEVLPSLPYSQYMGLMEEGDLSLDSFHFAGCNTVADSLFLRKPTIVWEGDKWYNRIGPAMLRLAGMDEWICQKEEEFLTKALALIHDDARREAISAQLRATDLDTTVFSTADAPSFLRAVNYLIANHERLKEDKMRTPLVIS